MQPNRAAHPDRIPVSVIEHLEPRRLLSTVYLHDANLYVTGTHKQDFISIYVNARDSSKMEVRIGREVWQFTAADVGNIRINGGAGDDRIGIDEGEIEITISVPTRIYGGPGNDTILGGSGRDRIYGGDGDDSILGGISADAIYGDAGNDWVNGGNADDSLHGKRIGNVIKAWSGDLATDHVWGGDGNDTLDGSYGDDTLDGGADDDFITGGAASDRLLGGDGNDTLLGGSGRDRIYGGEGDDSLDGGAGEDWLSGDAGNDSVYGGIGTDTFSISDDLLEDKDIAAGETRF